MFPAETIARVAQTVARFTHIAVSHYGVPRSQTYVLATEAMRRAANGGDMLAAIAAATASVSGELLAPSLGAAAVGDGGPPKLGPITPLPVPAATPGGDAIRVNVLAGEVETLLGPVGALSGFAGDQAARGGLILDLGGGSVQMTYLDPQKGVGYDVEAARGGISLPFGAAALLRLLVPPEGDKDKAEGGVVDSKEWHAGAEATKLDVRTKVAAAFANLRQRYHPALESAADGSGKQAGIDVYLCGGGFRGYGSMLMHLDALRPYPIPSVGAYTVPGSVFRATEAARAANEDPANRDVKIFGMSRRRRAQFPATLAVVEALVAAVPNIRTATFCAGSNKEGALMMKLPAEVRDANPLPLLARVANSETVFGTGASSAEDKEAVAHAVLATLGAAVPAGSSGAPPPSSSAGAASFSSSAPPPSTILTVPGLSALFPLSVWSRIGEDATVNAAFALHDAVTRDPSAPGLTHAARAALGATTCWRWGGRDSLGGVDRELLKGLEGLLARGDGGGDGGGGKAVFWARYLGNVAAAVAVVVPCWPRRPEVLERSLRFEAVVEQGRKKEKISLRIKVSKDAARGVDLDADLRGLFKDLLKQGGDDKATIKLSDVAVELMG